MVDESSPQESAISGSLQFLPSLISIDPFESSLSG